MNNRSVAQKIARIKAEREKRDQIGHKILDKPKKR